VLSQREAPLRPKDLDRAGPEAEFSAAVAAEIPRLRRFARVLARPPEVADDLVQETLLRAIAARARFTAGTNLRAWLFAILRHARAADLRRESRSPLVGQVSGVGVGAVSGGQEEREVMRELDAAFARLPADQREALWLVVVEGLEYGRAAEVLGVPMGTLRSRLSRARDALRRALDADPGSNGAVRHQG
jgi:RNA polymerase sigma-70 factor (ECF subfamily)